MLKTIIVVTAIIFTFTPSRADAGIFVSLGLVKPVNAFDKLDQGAVRVDAGYRFGILSVYTNLSGISVDTSIESNDAIEVIQESSLGEYELYTAIGVGANLYIPVYKTLDLIVGAWQIYLCGEVELSEDNSTSPSKVYLPDAPTIKSESCKQVYKDSLLPLSPYTDIHPRKIYLYCII